MSNDARITRPNFTEDSIPDDDKGERDEFDADFDADDNVIRGLE